MSIGDTASLSVTPPELAISAAARVFGIGELAEAILICAEPADILRCRSVSRKCFETITYSRSIRKKLFLEPDFSRDRCVNPLPPAFFHHQAQPYRPNTVGARIDLVELWKQSTAETRPSWGRMLVSQPPATTCVIPVGEHITVYHQRYYPDGMTFGDLERAVISAFEIRKGRKSSPERLNYLSERNSVLIYWPSKPSSKLS